MSKKNGNPKNDQLEANKGPAPRPPDYKREPFATHSGKMVTQKTQIAGFWIEKKTAPGKPVMVGWYIYWLVVKKTILKHMSQWEGWHPIYEMDNKKCLKPPTSFLCAQIFLKALNSSHLSALRQIEQPYLALGCKSLHGQILIYRLTHSLIWFVYLSNPIYPIYLTDHCSWLWKSFDNGVDNWGHWQVLPTLWENCVKPTTGMLKNCSVWRSGTPSYYKSPQVK